MVRRVGWLVGLALLPAGCALGPRALTTDRLAYNEAVKTTSEEQLLLNIVRLRYTDTPSSLAVTSVADQRELTRNLGITPFFTAAAAGLAPGGYRGTVLPQAGVTAATRPTLTYTPEDDQTFTQRLFTPLSLDAIASLSKTTWPTETVFRLWLENLNWVSNAETASGPTPRDPPDFAAFRDGVAALQRLVDRKLAAISVEEVDDPVGDELPAGAGVLRDAVEAAKAGLEVKRTDGGYRVIRKKRQPTLRVADAARGDPDFAAVCRAFRLDPGRTTFLVTSDKLDPFLQGTPPAGLDRLDLETRSLLQVLFFVAHGVDVPADHAAGGLAPQTQGADGKPFDWDLVLRGLFKVCCSAGKHPPACAHVAVRYKGYWFYVDERDRDTKATFALLLELSRLQLSGEKGDAGPILTLPIGGR
ncbi:MAG: hypothetical protein K2X82_31445 [Gemmataceae bacterium]|nr:hypothetical protein [Gemmataceae bacterium]